MTCILELNDADLTLYRNHAVLHRSAGIAVVLGNEVHFGDAALRLSRIHPRHANQQYFARLNADPLSSPGERARNHADLVYLHLQTFKPFIDAEGGEVLLAVPGILSPDQLGVLLGVLQEVGIGVSGFVDSAVAAVSTAAIAPPAAVSTQTSPEPCYYLDVMMQRTVVTALEVNAEVRKTSSQELPDCGLSRLLDGWINVIADRFVRETRFDPLHSAATEQQLFDQVYRWIDDGGSQSDLVLEIVHGDHTRRVELGRGLLEDKGEQRFRQLSDALPRAARVFVSARSMRLPGLLRALDDLHVKAQPLPADALPRGCVLNLALIVPENRELRLVTRLPHSGPAAEIDPSADSVTAARPAATETPADADETADPAATHALLGGEAWPLDARELALPIRQQNGRVLLLAEPGLRLNGDDLADARALLPGDRVSRGEAEYLIIHVRSRD